MNHSNIFTNPQFPSNSKAEPNYSFMLKDKVLMEIKGDRVTVLKHSLLPLTMRGKREITRTDFNSWLDKRILSFQREYYKILLNNLGLDESDTSKIALKCRALSLTDCYWIRTEEDSHLTWADVNLYNNKFSEAVGHIAFTGEVDMSVTGDYITPELTNWGMFAKCWIREDTGLYLYKSNTLGGKESEIEFIVSQLLTAAGIEHVPYKLEVFKGRKSSKCKNISNQQTMIIPAYDVLTFFSDLQQQPVQNIKRMWGEKFNQMLVVDYLINNYDRHTYNWGFYMDADTGNVIDIHPLFDHNCALDFSQETHYSKIYTSQTLAEVATNAYNELKDKSVVNKVHKYLTTNESRTLFKGLFSSNIDEKIKSRCEQLMCRGNS